MSVQAAPDQPSRGEAFRASVLADQEPDDPAALELLDLAAATMNEIAMLEADINERGVTIIGARGQPIAHPGLAAIVRHRALLSKLLTDLFPGDRETQTEKMRRAARARWGRA